MRKTGFVIAFIFGCLAVSAQETLELSWSMPIDASTVWDNDEAGNVYVFRNQAISKLDTNGKQLLTQSAKSIGQVAKIDASNWMKIALFSEEQQQICYLDNALGLLPDCIDLSSLGISLASQFCTSRQTDRIWVYDQLNSELQLVTLRTSQRQIVQNLRGITETGQVIDMTETNNSLLVLDDKGKLLLFDNFGTLITTHSVQAGSVFPKDERLFFTRDKHIYSIDANERISAAQALPVDGPIQQFAAAGNRILVSTSTHFYSFRVR